MKLGISSKIWIAIIIILFIGSLFNYWTTEVIYEHFYVNHQEDLLKNLGSKIMSYYHGGNISDEFKNKIKDINSFTNEEIVLADNLNTLGQCLPILNNTENPVSKEQIAQLHQGLIVTIIGKHTECNMDIIAIAYPIINTENKFLGAVFIYTPLATVTEALSKTKMLLILYFLLFLLIGIIFGKIITNKITKPLRKMETIAKRMMDGEFDAKIMVKEEDEIGKLGKTLNHLSDSLKEMIDLLSKEKNQLSQILDGISDSVLTIYRNTDLILCNDPSKNLFRKLGLNKEQFTKIPEIEEIIERVKVEKQVLIAEINIKERIFVLYFGPLIDEDELWGIVIVIHDVTKEQKRENDAREFLAIVSHELRTPLSYVKGYTEALLDGVAQSEEMYTKYLKTIQNETERMERLVNDLLQLEQLERETYPIAKDDILINNIILQVLDRYLASYKNKGVKLEYNNISNQDIWMVGDEDKIIQILVNLLDNALRYTQKDGRVIIETYHFKDDVVIKISDTGKGIKKEYLDKIGDKFFRAEKARSRNNGGLGLGLAIVKQIIDRLHGRLEIESELDVGTTFTIFFPANKKH